MNTAIIGLGRMGRRHAQVARGLGLRLVGVCDHNEETLAAVGDAFGIPRDRQFCNAGDLLARTRPECVIVATTTPTHCLFTCEAATAGVRYVLCEKPMAASLAECDEMLAVCREQGARLAVNHQMRFMPHYQESKRIAASEGFGGLTSVTVVGGNCGMATNGVHYFEMFRYLTDEPPYDVTAWLSADSTANPRGVEFEDRAGAVRVTTRQGRRLYLEIGADQGHGLTVICAGPYGQLVVDELSGTMQLTVREAAHRSAPTTRYGCPSVESTLKTEPAESMRSTAAVLGALVSGDGAPTGEEARLAVSVLVAAHVSHEQAHRAVRLDEALPRDRLFAWA